MSGFLRLVGSALLFLFIATLFFGEDIKGFFPDEYKSISDDLLNNKWSLLVLSIVLSVAGSITKVTKVIKEKRRNSSVSNLFEESDSNQVREINDAYGISSSPSPVERTDSSFAELAYQKSNFVSEQYKYKGEEFANKQQGKLKDIAMKVDWTPLRSGGANFKTDQLKQINSTRFEVHKSTGGYLFSGVFALVGLFSMIFGSYVIIQDHGLSFSILAPILFGGVFAAVGIGMMIFPRTRIFDRRYGWFWAGSKALAREQDFMKLKKSARLSEIAAIQIINEHVSSSKGGSYRSWEINLVSDNGQRLNVMDHGNKDSIVADAQKLGEFLGVPVWDNM